MFKSYFEVTGVACREDTCEAKEAGKACALSAG